MENSNKEAEAIISWQYMDDLKSAFEAGENFNNECHCGECSYCIDVKDEDAPNFEDWYLKTFGHFRKPSPQPVESVEEAAYKILAKHTGTDIQYLHSRNRIIMAMQEYANFIKRDHVPIEEVVKIIYNYGAIRLSSTHELIRQIKSLNL